MPSLEAAPLAPHPETTQDLLAQEIMAKMGELYTTGATDSEPEVLKSLLQALTQGQITPLEARARLNTLLASRQDYH